MLLAVDIGNTNIVFGLFKGKDLVSTWRLATLVARTSDEYGLFIINGLNHHNIKAESLKGAVVASVVPSADLSIQKALDRYIDLKPLFIRPGIKTGLPIHYDPPQDVGADRIVNAVALKEYYGAPGICVDFGTATTFDIISSEGAYEGGIIAPGVNLSADTLHARAARLPRVDVRKPDELIGKSTIGSIQSGLYYGYLSLVEGILMRLEDRIGPDLHVVATGGLAPLFAEEIPLVQCVDLDLTLKGLQILHDRNQ